MKKLLFVVLGLCCSVLAIAVDSPDSDNLALLSGTYTNSQYQAEGRPSRIVFSIVEAKFIIVTWYNKISDRDPAGQEIDRIIETWREKDGAIWYKFQNAAPEISNFILTRLSPDHSTLEQVGSDKAYPKEIGSQGGWHSVWHRK